MLQTSDGEAVLQINQQEAVYSISTSIISGSSCKNMNTANIIPSDLFLFALKKHKEDALFQEAEDNLEKKKSHGFIRT